MDGRRSHDGDSLEAMAIAIEQSDAIIMCVTHRYKESHRLPHGGGPPPYSRKKKLIPVMMEFFAPDGWLGIIMGAKLYYNMHTVDEMSENVKGVIGEVRTVHQSLGRADNNGGLFSSVGPTPQHDIVGGGGDATSPGREEGERSAPDAETMTSWLEERGLQRYAISFASAHVYGKAAACTSRSGLRLRGGTSHDKFKTVLDDVVRTQVAQSGRSCRRCSVPSTWQKRR